MPTLKQISPMMKSTLTYVVSPGHMVSSLFTLQQVFDEELDSDRSVVEKTVNLSVADGEKHCVMHDLIDDGP